eukprot:1471604-Rhodomonas_salina.1
MVLPGVQAQGRQSHPISRSVAVWRVNSATALRTPYAMSGTDVAYGVAGEPMTCMCTCVRSLSLRCASPLPEIKGRKLRAWSNGDSVPGQIGPQSCVHHREGEGGGEAKKGEG